MVAFLSVGVTLGRLVRSESQTVATDMNFPDVVYPFEGSPAPTHLWLKILKRKGRAINWRPMSVLKYSLVPEIQDLINKIGDRSHTIIEVKNAEGIREIPDQLPPKNRESVARRDYTYVSPRFENAADNDRAREELQIFKLVDPIAEKLTFQGRYRGDQIVGFNYSRKKPFLLFNLEKSRYARCGFIYADEFFLKKKSMKHEKKNQTQKYSWKNWKINREI